MCSFLLISIHASKWSDYTFEDIVMNLSSLLIRLIKLVVICALFLSLFDFIEHGEILWYQRWF